MSAEQQQPLSKTKTSSNVLSMKTRFSQMQGDLLDRYGARDFIVIDGHGLLFTLLHSESLDWREHGGQFLHFIFLLERFIQSLLDRQIRFEVLFCSNLNTYFDDSDNNLFNPYAILLAKRVMVQHLRNELKVTCVDFDVWSTQQGQEQMKEYMLKKHPSLIVGNFEAHGGSLLLMYCKLHFGVNFVTNLTPHGNTILGYVGSVSELARGNRVRLINSIIQCNNERGVEFKDTIILGHTLAISCQLRDEIGEIFGSDPHLMLMVNALCSLLARSKPTLKSDKIQMCQIVFLSVLLQKRLPLSFRAQELAHPACQEINNFIYAVYRELSSSDLETVYQMNSLNDLLDCRLVHRLCMFYSQTQQGMSKGNSNIIQVFGLNEDDEKLLKAFQGLIQRFVLDDTFSAVSPIWKKVSDQVQKSKGNKKEAQQFNNKLFPLRNELVDAFLGDEWKRMFSYYNPSDNICKASPEARIFEERYHWHSTRELNDDKSFVPKTTKEIEKQMQSKERLRLYSQSLSKCTKPKIINDSNRKKERGEETRASHKTEMQKLRLFNIDLVQSIKDEEARKSDEPIFLTKDILNNFSRLLGDVYDRIYSLLLEENRRIRYHQELEQIEINFLRYQKEQEQHAKQIKLLQDEMSKKERDIEAVDDDDDWENLEARLDEEEKQDIQEPIDFPNPPVFDLIAYEKRKKFLDDQIRQETDQFANLQERMAMLTDSRRICESAIVGQLKRLSSLFLEELESTDSFKDEKCCWNAFESLNILYEYIIELNSDDHSRRVGLKSVELINSSRRAPHIKTDEVLQFIASGLVKLGFVDYAKELFAGHDHIKIPTRESRARVKKLSSQTYQLLYNSSCSSCSDYLPPDELVYFDREKDKADKMSSLGFRPDPWQQELIDHVDQQKSVLVSAPTSSGKTFIAFYVIEKVLRESNDGVVVFVCPTKALVNQLYAEVYSKFQKGDKMVGMFTADDKIHVTSCQVLITVPQCMEILMLTASNRDWTKRLRAVILDEIHCISDAESGSVWEHILLMITCPFIALSATIGNALEFKDWLNLNKKNVELVEHKDRPRPLEYFVYEDVKSELVEIHPCATLNAYNIDQYQIKNMQAMSPIQCLTLYQTARELVSNRQGTANIFEGLAPEQALPRVGLLSRNDLNLYSNELKKRLIIASEDPEQILLLKDIILQLSHDVNRAYKGKSNWDRDYLDANVTPLINQLRDQSLLPCISFSFDRRICFSFAKIVTEHLRGTGNHLWDSKSDKHKAITEIEIVIGKLEKEGQNIPLELLDALRLGVACHYSGLADSYCKEVERLFRMRHIPIVFATSTLALGINMPCKTVVMAGHSLYLNAILFNQCSGRAGRRNFDNKGRVVMFGLPQVTVNRLMTAEIPKIMGSMSLHHSFVLRLMTMFNESMKLIQSTKGKAFDIKRLELINSTMVLLDQPLFALGKTNHALELQVRHQFRFILEVLMRTGYLDCQGESVNFTGLVNHLFFYEPANFILVDFIRRGLLHQLLDQCHADGVSDTVADERILAVLCHLFCRRVVKPSNQPRTAILPLLPDSFLKASDDYYAKLFEIYVMYMRNYATTMKEQLHDEILPVSGISFVKKNYEPKATNQFSTAGVEDFNPIIMLENQRFTYHACSSFAALSGNDDIFKTLELIPETLNHNILFDISLIPWLDMKETLSSFVIEYYKTGELDLKKFTCMFSETEMFNLISQFARDLAKIHSSLSVMNVSRNDPLLRIIDRIKRELKAKLNGFKSYESMKGLDFKSRRFDATRIGEKFKKRNAEIVLSVNQRTGKPQIAVLLDGGIFDQRTRLGPRFFSVTKHTEQPHASCYLHIPDPYYNPNIITMKLKGIEHKYEVPQVEDLKRSIHEYNKMYIAPIKQICFSVERKPRYEEKRRTDEEG